MPTIIQQSFGSPSYDNQRRKRNERNPDWKRKVKLSLFADNMILYTSEVTQSCLTLCDPVNCSPPGSSVHGILQARILEWMPFPSPEDLPDLETELWSPELQADFLPFEL